MTLTPRELMCVYLGFTQDSRDMDEKFILYAIASTAKLLKIPEDELIKLTNEVKEGMHRINNELGKMVEKAKRTHKDPFTNDDGNEEAWR